MARQPTITFEAAAAVCAEPYLTEGQAHEQALLLKQAGWVVEWRNPPYPESGKGSGVRISASIYHPDPDHDPVSPGDVMFRLETEL